MQAPPVPPPYQIFIDLAVDFVTTPIILIPTLLAGAVIYIRARHAHDTPDTTTESETTPCQNHKPPSS